MKTINRLFAFLVSGIIFFSCQKPFTIEQGFNSAGTLNKDAAGNCTPVNINGIFKAGVVLAVSNYIDVSVNVTAAGSYSIASDTLNSIYFNATGDFTTAGVQVVRLSGHGTPVNAGVSAFTIHYNNSSSCAVQVTVNPAGASATAAFTLAGAPGACTTPILQGTYTVGTILGPANKLIVTVNVTSLGIYALSTPVINGISFSATGTFTALNTQTVTLAGSGTPLTAGTNNMTISGTVASCGFPLTVGSTTGSGTYLAAIYYIDTTLSVPFDTIERGTFTYDAFNRIISIKTFDTKPNGDSDYYSLQTIIYNGSDTLASRKTEYYKVFSSTPFYSNTSTTYYGFVNGRMVSDSTPSPTGYHVEKYVYNGNIVLRNEVTVSTPNLPSPSLGSSTIRQTFVNGNNTYQLDTLVNRFANQNNPSTWHYQRMEVNTSYSPNPNPVYQINKAFLRPYYYDDMGIGSGATPKNLIVQQNTNLLIWNGNNPGSLNVNQINYTYTFRQDGYPVEGRTIFINNSSPATYKVIFVYR